MSELDITYVGKQAKSMDTAPQLDRYSRVTIAVSDNLEYTAGTDTGAELRLTNPFGTQEMCENILKFVRGYAYQPASASGAQIDPAAELGDGITIGSVYTGIYAKKAQFGPLHTADVEAPAEKEIPHEYEYKSQSNREVNRRFASVKSELKVHADEIAAKVAQEGGAEDHSMGWSLKSDKWEVTANSQVVFTITKDGGKFTGTIEALAGKIGGLTLKDSALTTNDFSWYSTNSYGLYVGPNGIRLGQNFKVDSAGNLTASSGRFSGTVYAGSIQYGGDAGTFDGYGITGGSIQGGKIVSGDITTAQTSGGINESLGYANYANDVFNGRDKSNWIVTDYIKLGGHLLNFTSIDGKKVVGWS